MIAHVDVVIPVFNGEHYIGEAIASVLAQQGAVTRIIVVDDGSTDRSADVARRHGAAVDVIVAGRNEGSGSARNRGIAAASAEFVAFLDADDRWLPGKLAAQLVALAADRRAMFALCRTRAFASPELPADERTALLAAQGSDGEGWLPSAMLARREIFAQVGNFSTDVGVSDGVDWFVRARPTGYVEIPDLGVERRLHRSNSTRRAAGDRSDYLRVAHRHLQRLRERGAG